MNKQILIQPQPEPDGSKALPDGKFAPNPEDKPKMPFEKKVAIGILIILITILAYQQYNMRGWGSEKGYLCASWTADSIDDFKNGYLCVLNMTTCASKIESNTEKRTCVCLRNDKNVVQYCNKKVKVFDYNGFKPTPEQEYKSFESLASEMNMTLEQLNYVLGGAVNLIKPNGGE